MIILLVLKNKKVNKMKTRDLLDKITRKFLLNEEKDAPSINEHVENLNEFLNKMQPRSMNESKKFDTARKHLQEIKKLSRQLEEQIQLLEEGEK